jgi:MFS family permease
MNSRQLIALFVCLLVPWTMGNGLVPLLPVYATGLGASPTVVGYYLSFAYLILALGTFFAGWLSDKVQRRKSLLILFGVPLAPTIWLLGSVANVWQLTIITSIAWFLGGIAIALINILAGLSAEKSQRGKTFGILSVSSGLGALIGGLVTGPVADRWGFPAMFTLLAGFSLLLPLAALFLKDKSIGLSSSVQVAATSRESIFEMAFLLLLVASTAGGIGVFSGRLGTSLAMKDLQFSSAAISSTGAVGGLVTLPLAPLVGWLSDRLGRVRLLSACYFAGSIGLILLAASASLWHFWIVASLVSILAYVSTGVGSALVTDLVSPSNLGRGMSLFTATIWVGGIGGFAGTGLAVQRFGIPSTFVVAALLPVFAIILVLFVRRAR